MSIEACVLVIALHGATGNGPSMRAVLGDSLSQYPSVRVVTPSSPTKVWDLRAGSYSEDQILPIARASACKTKVLVGFSNGAYMSTALQCRYPKIFTGVFAVNGWARTYRCPLRDSSVLTVVHSADDTVIPANGQLSPPVSWIIPSRFWAAGKDTVRWVRDQTPGDLRYQRIRWEVHEGGHSWVADGRLTRWMRQFV